MEDKFTTPLQLARVWLAAKEAERRLGEARRQLSIAESQEFGLGHDAPTVVSLPGTEGGAVIVTKTRTIDGFGATRYTYDYKVTKVLKNA